MPTRRRSGYLAVATLMAAMASTFGAPSARAADANAPQLRKQGAATQLIVEGKPFLILGEALSDTSAAAWARLAAAKVNTALVAVKGSAVEPKPGQFDFAAVDALIKDAQANKMHLVVRWRGGSAAAPAFGDPTADAAAFAALLKHLAATDTGHAVIAAQVEDKFTLEGDTAAGKPVAQVAGYLGKVAAAGKAAYAIPLYVECTVDKPEAATAFLDACRTAAPAIDLIAPDIRSANFAAVCAKFSRADNPLLLVDAEGGATGAAKMLYALGKFNAIGVAGVDAPAPAPAAATAPGAPEALPAAFFSTVAGLAPGILENQGKGTMYAFMFGPGATDEAATQELVKIGQFNFTVRASGGGGGGAGGPGGRRGAGGGGAPGGAAPGTAPGGAAAPAIPGLGATLYVAAPAAGGGGGAPGAGGGGGRRGPGGGGPGGGGGIGTSTTVAGLIIALKPNEYLCLHSGLGISLAPVDPSLGAFALGFQETGNYVDGKWKTYARTNGDENDHDRGRGGDIISGVFGSRWTNLHMAYYQRP